MIALRSLGAAFVVNAFLCSIGNSQEVTTIQICVGSGGLSPPWCEQAKLFYSCQEYRTIGGGSAATVSILKQKFCKDSRSAKVTVPYDVAGGECGWTLFNVNCSN
jgi:hypothetical protein